MEKKQKFQENEKFKSVAFLKSLAFLRAKAWRLLIISYFTTLVTVTLGTNYTNAQITSDVTLGNESYKVTSQEAIDIEAVKITGYPLMKNNTVPNHEYLDSSFSSIYMSRNRVRSWDEPSFTIQAGGRHVPINPQANKMIWLEKDKWMFDPNLPKPYRRLSVRECARIQTFSDNFIFEYKNINDGYKMVGNAVPVNFARILASKIKEDIQHS